MITPQRSRKRILAGLFLAIPVAPVSTVICVELALMLSPAPVSVSVADEIGGAGVFIVIAFFFGGFLAAVPVLVIGSIAVVVAHCLGTKSPVFYAATGLLGGLFMAWMDIVVRKDVFEIWGAIPFIVGGCLSALTYWSVAER